MEGTMIGTDCRLLPIPSSVLALIWCFATTHAQAGGPAATRSAPTVRITMPDSMRVSIRDVLDTLPVALSPVSVQSVHDPVQVSLPTVTTRTERDGFDWLLLLGSVLVAPMAALGAAWWGARVGGETARNAAIE